MRSGISLTCWVAALFYLRRPEDAAADADSVARWERARDREKSRIRARRRSAAEARDASSPAEDDDEDAAAGTPLQPLGVGSRAVAEQRYGTLSL